MNRRRLVAVTMFVAPFVAAGVACTFPDVTFGPDGTGEGGTGDGSQGGPAEGGGGDVMVLPDGNIVGDAAVRTDANQVLDANVCATKPKCDCDEDGFLDINCDAGPDAAGPGKLPGDCDDLDKLRNPNAGYTEAEPTGHDGDWNCNKTVEYFPPRNLKCGGNGTTGCTGGAGFLSAPPCATKADYYSCEPQANLLAPCQAKASGGQATQACK